MFKEIWNFATTHLPAWAVFVLMIFLLVAFAVKTVSARKELREPLVLFLKKRIYKVKSADLKAHGIFREKTLLLHRIEMASFEDKIKEAVLKIVHRVKINTDLDFLKEFIEGQSYKSEDFSILATTSEIVSETEKRFNQSVYSELQNYCEREIGDKDKSELCATEMFALVMNRPQGFLSQRMKRVESLFESAELIESSPLFDDSYEQVYQLLDVMKVLLSNAVMKIERMFKSFNGEFVKIMNKYKQ